MWAILIFLQGSTSFLRFGVYGLRKKSFSVQGYLAHKKEPPPLGPPYDPRYRPTEGSQGGAFSYEEGVPVEVEMKCKCGNPVGVEIL